MKEYIVALHLDRPGPQGVEHTVRLGIYWAATSAEAFGQAVMEHTVNGWALGAWRAGALDAIRGQSETEVAHD